MTLTRKTAALFISLGIALTSGSYLALSLGVMPAFDGVDRILAGRDLDRVQHLLQSDMHALRVMNIEYSAWDHTYDYAMGRRPEFFEENMDPEYWHSVDANMMLIFDSAGGLISGYVGDPEDGRELEIDQILPEPLGPHHQLVQLGNANVAEGYYLTSQGLMSVVSAPILNSRGEGPAAGSLVLGKFLTAAHVDSLSERSIAEVAIHRRESNSTMAAAQENTPSQTADSDSRIVDDGTHYRFYHALEGLDGDPVGLLEVVTPKRIAAVGRQALKSSMLSLAATCTMFVLAMLWLVQRMIVAPVVALRNRMVKIRETGDLRSGVDSGRADELGNLEAEFSQLTRQLDKAHGELLQARDEAMAHSNTKSEFLARMSHEIRTPMNGVVGMTSLLMRTTLDQNQTRYAHSIADSATALLAIIDDILDFSRVEAGKMEIEPEILDLRLLVEECVASVSDSAQSKGLELTILMPGEVDSWVEVDPTRLRQVLINLVGNAIKFTEDGEVLVNVTPGDCDAGFRDWTFEVIDTGVGIDTESQAKIFELFSQADGTTTRKYGGTGLGLAISRELVNLMGGHLAVDSIPGVGSKFHFSLRLREAQSQGDQRPGTPQLSLHRVLVVDNNANSRQAVINQLESWAIPAKGLGNSEAAADLLCGQQQETGFDMVLLDTHNPRSGGIDLARRLRQEFSREQLDIVLLSAVTEQPDPAELESLEIADSIPKPVRQSDLYDALVNAHGKLIDEELPQPVPARDEKLAGHVLLVEDNPVNQEVALDMLRSLGLRVTMAKDGAEALALFRKARFDTIMMDCQMPVMDGFECMKAIRQEEFETGALPVPIVAVTANALAGDRERCLEAGATDYLSKPYSYRQLEARLATIVELTGSTPSSVDAPNLQPANDPECDSPLDTQVLNELAGKLRSDGTPLLDRLIDLYLETAPPLMARIAASVESMNSEDLRDAAHELKSSSAHVGAHRLATLCASLEDTGSRESTQAVSRLTARLQTEYRIAVEALIRYRSSQAA